MSKLITKFAIMCHNYDVGLHVYSLYKMLISNGPEYCAIY